MVAHQQITNEWWREVRPQVECFVSPFVIDEASRGDAAYAEKRLDEIAGFPVLEVNEHVEELRKSISRLCRFPIRARVDAFHLAIAAWLRR